MIYTYTQETGYARSNSLRLSRSSALSALSKAKKQCPARFVIPRDSHDLPPAASGSSFAFRVFGRLEDDKTGLLLFSFNTTEGGSSGIAFENQNREMRRAARGVASV